MLQITSSKKLSVIGVVILCAVLSAGVTPTLINADHINYGAGLVSDSSRKLTTRPQITSSFVGVPADDQVIVFIPIAVATKIPASCTGSYMGALTAATSSTTFTLYYLAGGPTATPTSFGTAVFSSSGNMAAFTYSTSHSFSAGDYLEVKGPATHDSTLGTLGMNLLGSAQ